MTRLPRLSVLALVLTATACDDSGGGDGGGGDDGAATDDADSDSGSGGAVVCEGEVHEVLAPQPLAISGLTVVDDAVVVMTWDPTFVMETGIDRIGVDGTRTTLHRSVDDRRVVSVFAYRDTAYFLEVDDAEAIAMDELWQVPLAGGDATRVGAIELAEAEIVAVDDAGIFVRRRTIDPVGSVFERIDPGTGVLTTVGASVDTGTPLQMRVTADDIVFAAGGVGSNANAPTTVWALDKHGENGTPRALWTVDPSDDPCGFPLGGMFATPTKLACGFTRVATRALDGSAPEILLERDVLSPMNLLVASDAENLYVLDNQAYEPVGHLQRLRTDDATLAPIACGLGKVANRVVDGYFPNQTEWEVRVGDADVFWIEEHFDGAAYSFAIRSAPK